MGTLDKLAQYGKTFEKQEESFVFELKSQSSRLEENLSKRQKNKALSKHVAIQMVNGNKESRLKKQYWNTYHCCNTLIYDDKTKKLIGRYCKNRICIVCNRIRMAKNIKEFVPLLATWKEMGFVTLSTVNCCEGEIRNQVSEYMRVIELIKKKWNYKKKKEVLDLGFSEYEYKKLIYSEPQDYILQAVVKIEVTYNENRNDFHPHLHLLVNGYEQSDFVANSFYEIMKRRKMTIDLQAQMVKRADIDSVIEMMKYFTKIFSSSKNGLSLNPKKLDTILTELYKIPLVRCIGITKREREFYMKKFEKVAEINIDLGNEKKVYEWVDSIFNWVEKKSGEMLCKTEIPIEHENYIRGKTKTLEQNKKEVFD